MPKPIETILIEEIRATEKRIETLVASIGIKGDRSPLTIIFGSDIESRLSDPAGRLETEEPAMAFRQKVQDFIDEIGDASAILAIHRDLDRQEILLRPGTSHAVLSNYGQAKFQLELIAQEQGLNLRMGQGHWHLSLMQGENLPLGYPGHHSPFSKVIAARLLDDQFDMPALFTQPRKAEKKKVPPGVCPDYGISEDKGGTIRLSHWRSYDNGSPFFEMRVAHLAPHLPVLMILGAIEQAIGPLPPPRWCRGPVNYDDHDAPLAVHQGPASYLSLLEVTLRAASFERRFGHIRMPLARALIASYRAFLARPYKGDYTPEQLEAQRYKLDDLEQSLSAKTPSARRPQAGPIHGKLQQRLVA